jgi:hypothetical protein
MKFALKDYKTLNTKQYIKSTNLFFVFNGIDQNSKDSIKTKQKLKNINFNCYKVFNKTSTKILKNSIYKNIAPIINGGTFFLKPAVKKALSKKILFNNFENLMFIFLASKINNKIYFSHQLKNVNILNYYKNNLLLYQFLISNLKNRYLF